MYSHNFEYDGTYEEQLIYFPEEVAFYENLPNSHENAGIEPNELIRKIELFIEDILIKIDEDQELEIFLIDLDLNSVFNYDLGHYTLPESLDGVKYSKINLFNNSEKITKMIKIASIIHNKVISGASYSTKR
jgi:hypothetical protein